MLAVFCVLTFQRTLDYKFYQRNSGQTCADLAGEGIAAFKAWLNKIGAPVSLKAVGIEGETLEEVVNLAHDYAVNWRKDKLYIKENIKEIFELAK